LTTDRRALGAEGEARAARYLEERGYRILGRNVRAGGVEIDLVAARGYLVVFVEVKTRRSRRLGPPELAVDAGKQRRLLRGAAAWLRDHPGLARRTRFDVVTCAIEPGSPRPRVLRHWEGAFEGGGG
jgi:putative endonuclease